ncbi:MAG TPA: TRAP transporter small permease subunit [Burkholderiales bacterium]|jgi:TRAP-type mannitol/chloroaromatic compound transport system permease small subunit
MNKPRHALPGTVRIAEQIRRLVDFIGRWGGWLVLPVVIITCIDVVGRKLGYEDDAGRIHSLQLWLSGTLGRFFESTVLQELEWHFHAALFALVLGYGVIYNTHVRIDLIRDHLEFRRKAWLELIGLSGFMLPYCAIVIWFAFDYTYASYFVSEQSASTVGLTHRWIIKSVLVFGLLVATLSGIAAWLQVVTILWGPREARFPLMTLDWPEEETKIEGKERVRLEDDYGLRLSEAPGAEKPASATRTQPATAQAVKR